MRELKAETGSCLKVPGAHCHQTRGLREHTPQGTPGGLGRRGVSSQQAPTGRSKHAKTGPAGTTHFRDADTEAQSRRALGPSHTGGEQQNATWNPMPSPQFWNQTHRLLEDSEVRKENRASGDVRLGATRSEGQEKLGLGGPSHLHFHPSRPATLPSVNPAGVPFPLLGPLPRPRGLYLSFSRHSFSLHHFLPLRAGSGSGLG